MSRSGPSKNMKHLLNEHQRRHATAIAAANARLEALEAATFAADASPDDVAQGSPVMDRESTEKPEKKRGLLCRTLQFGGLALVALIVLPLVALGAAGTYGFVGYRTGSLDTADLLNAWTWINTQADTIISAGGLFAAVATVLRGVVPAVKNWIAARFGSFVAAAVQQQLSRK